MLLIRGGPFNQRLQSMFIFNQRGYNFDTDAIEILDSATVQLTCISTFSFSRFSGLAPQTFCALQAPFLREQPTEVLIPTASYSHLYNFSGWPMPGNLDIILTFAFGAASQPPMELVYTRIIYK